MTAATMHRCILPANTNSALNEPDCAAALALLTDPGFLSLRTTYAFFTQSGVNLNKFNCYELLARWSRRSKAKHRSVPQQS